MSEPRFIIRELTGYPSEAHGGGARESTDVMVLDRWDCHNVVKLYRPASNAPLTDRQCSAKALANRLNEDHRRWLHAGRWT